MRELLRFQTSIANRNVVECPLVDNLCNINTTSMAVKGVPPFSSLCFYIFIYCPLKQIQICQLILADILALSTYQLGYNLTYHVHAASEKINGKMFI